MKTHIFVAREETKSSIEFLHEEKYSSLLLKGIITKISYSAVAIHCW
jgi:hypothetical protein